LTSTVFPVPGYHDLMSRASENRREEIGQLAVFNND
jgi:hypothetical protein